MSPLVALLLLFTGLALLCPPRCHPCSPSMVQCEHISSLTETLTGLPNNIEKIILHRGSLLKLHPQTFARFSRLHSLSITGCLVTSLTDLTFSAINGNGLRFLDLSSNHLDSCKIEPMAFSDLFSLRELILTNNSLDVLRKLWFSEMPLLRKLFLGANRISYLPPRMFENLTQLDELVVSSNLIQYLPMDTFYGMPLLTKLDLSSNRILFTHHEVFQPLQALKSLLLFQNQLTILPVLPGSIAFLFLHENPWECTCQLVASMESLRTKIQTPEVVTCNSPPSLVGHQVVSTRPAGCDFPPSSLPTSSPMSWISPLNSSNLSLLYGFLGGLLVGSVICLFCCYCFCFPKCCHGLHSGKEAESKKMFPSYWSRAFAGEGGASHLEPRVLCSFPIVGGLATEPCCGPIGRGSRTCHWHDPSADLQKPLVAVWSLDTMGSPVVTLHARGWEAGAPVADHACRRACDESDQKNGGSQEPRPFSLEDAFDELPLQKGTPGQGGGCASGKCVDSPSADWISHADVQLGDILLRQELASPRRSAVETEGNLGRAGEPPSKRNRSRRIRLHLCASHRGSTVKRNTVSPQRQSYYHQAQPKPPRCNQASEQRSRPEGFVSRRCPKCRNGKPSSSTDTDANARPLSTNRVNRRRKRTPLYGRRYSLTFGASSSSSSFSGTSSEVGKNDLTYTKEPYIEKRSISPLYAKKELLSPTFDDTLPARETPPESWEARNHGSEVGLEGGSATTKDTGTYLRLGYGKPSPPLIQQKADTQQSATPKASRRFLEVTTQQSSAGTVHLTAHGSALARPGPDYHPEDLREEEPSPWKDLLVLRPPFAVPPPEQSEVVDPGSTDQQPSVPALPTDVPVTEKTITTQLIFNAQLGSVDIAEMEEMEAVVGAPMASVFCPQSRSSRNLGEESMQVEGSLEMSLFAAAGQDLVEVNQDTVSSHSNVMRSEPCYDASRDLLFETEANTSALERSDSPGRHTDVPGDLYEEVATIVTSHCPVLQKMCQIDFSLGAEEEKLGKQTTWNEESILRPCSRKENKSRSRRAGLVKKIQGKKST